MRLLNQLRRLHDNFNRNQRGNMAIMAALTLMPIVAAVGAGIDYSRLSSQMSNYQQAADAAVLAAAKKRTAMTESELTNYARKIFNANLSNASNNITSFDLKEEKKNHKLTLKTVGFLETSFLGAVGINEMNFKVLSQVGLPSGGLEVAMVLDNTDSMRNDKKLKSLKIAAKNFINVIMPGKENKEKTLLVSIVPFGEYVNVGLNNRKKKWISVPDDYKQTKTYRPVIRQYDCKKKWYSYTSKGYTYEGRYYPPKLHQGWRTTCKKEYGPKKTYTKWHRWRGCVGSREYPRNLQDIEYNKEKVTGLIDKSCTKKVLPLTYNKKTLLNTIKKLRTKGETYIPTGITWGRRVLSKQSPFTGGSSAQDVIDEKTKQVLILMTDGQNTKSKKSGSPLHTNRNLVEANLWTKEACDNVKRDKIEVYTVTFGKDLDDDTKKLMRNCASSPKHYFDATSGKALDTSFKHIANSIRTVYLSK